ncbi:hypothetical protein [Idiomarina sp.]|uniref:hypothetical protein n=1 Tax=Idiomarina sp. TaxID=1874361 RepID=UPI0035118259
MMKRWLLSLSIASALMLPAASAVAQQAEHQGLKNQIEIFKDILTTAAKQQAGEDNSRLEDVEFTYLKGQGVVFFVRSARMPWRFVAPDVPEPPLPPEMPEMSGFAKDLQLDRVVEEGLRTAHRVLSQFSGEYSDEWFELVEQKRELAWEARDLNREMRDIEFQRDMQDKDASNETIEQREKELEAKLAELKEKQAQLDVELAEMKKMLKAKQDKVRKERLLTQEKSIEAIENVFSNVLCDYGITLKSLPDDEQVSLVIRDASMNKDKRLDNVYVFGKSAINSCDSQPDELLKQAQKYKF